MKPGDPLEFALWLTGRETPEQLEEAEKAISSSFDVACARHGVKIGPVIFEEKYPMDDRVPEVPDHVQGPDVRLLVATSEVISVKPQPKVNNFLAELEPDDLARLRMLTRKAYERHWPGSTLSDEDCDAVIEQIGPDAAVAAVRGAVNSGAIH